LKSNTLSANLFLRREDFELTIDITAPTNGVTAIFGASGSGKTTLLRCIAGLEKGAKGSVKFKEQIWQSEKTFIPVHKRPLGYVFQEASLFDHLTADKNLQYAIARGSNNTVTTKQQAVELLGIGDLLQRYPEQLSGGERQRVAIARALLVQPELLLMDEPLASLDAPRKAEILPYLEKLKSELSLPILYVTHAIDEIARLADYIIVMEMGKVLMQGTAGEVFSSVKFSHFQGEDTASILSGKVIEIDEEFHLCTVKSEELLLQCRDLSYDVGKSVRVRILARDVSLTTSSPAKSSILNSFDATVAEVQEDKHPGLTLVKIKIGDNHIVCRISSKSAHELSIKVGSKVWAQIKSVAIIQ